jgi:uncharacterized cupin superfamily protein
MTLQEAAERASLSVSFISSVERGVSGASPTAIARLREVYEDGVEAVHDDANVVVHHLGEGHSTVVAEGVEIEWLSAHPGLLEPQLYRLAPGAGSSDTYQHRGEEFVFALEGIFSITIDGKTHLLDAGSSVHFASHIPHQWRNSGDTEARILWVTTERGLWQQEQSRVDWKGISQASTHEEV